MTNCVTESEILLQELELELELARRQLGKDLYGFLKYFWDIATGEPYTENWHIPYICSILQKHLQLVIDRKKAEYDWIIINVPPGTSKSTIVSIMANPWAWTQDPGLRFITGSYDSKLATRLSVCSRDVIQCEKYRLLWGDKYGLKVDSNNKTAYDTTKRGSRMTCSVGGSITGHHGHVVIIDDPLDPAGEKSEAEAQSAIDWIDKTLPSRILNDEIALKVMIMQRLGEGDPTGHLLSKDLNILHICLPAEITELNNVNPPELAENYVDGLLDPARKGREVLRRRKVDLGSADYDTQYLQNPESAAGNIWERKYWKYYKEMPDLRPMRIVQSWDTAFDEKEENDYWCGTTWYQFQFGYYLADFFREQLRTPEGIKEIIMWNAKWKPHSILIEKKASGIVALQVLEDTTTLPLVPDIIPLTNKVHRAKAAVPTVEAGNVFLPENAPWTADLVSRLAKFPNGTHDDDSDSISQFLNWVREQDRGGISSISSSRPDIRPEGF